MVIVQNTYELALQVHRCWSPTTARRSSRSRTRIVYSSIGAGGWRGTAKPVIATVIG